MKYNIIKKSILLTSLILSTNVFSNSIDLQTQLINTQQIGHSDGYDEFGFVGTNTFKGEIQVTNGIKTVNINCIYYLSERKKSIPNIIIGDYTKQHSNSHVLELNKLKSINVSKQALESELIKMFASVVWD